MHQVSLLTPHPPWITDALGVLARHRFASARQLAHRLGVDEGEVASTLAVLARDGALRVLRQSTFAARDAAAPAYALTPAGLSLVAVDPTGLRPRATRSLRSALSLAHELLLNEFALVLERLDGMGRLHLLSWQSSRERIGDVTHLVMKGRVVRVPLVADGLAIVEVHGHRLGLLVEVDMGTVSVATMRRKFVGYHGWWQEGGPARRFGLAATRVLTIAPAPRRLERLRSLAIETNDGRGTGLLWFLRHAAVDVARPELLFDATATVGKAGDERPRSLFHP